MSLHASHAHLIVKCTKWFQPNSCLGPFSPLCFDIFIVHPVPNPVVTATAGASAVDSVSATWTQPEGIITGYDITCSSGTASPSSGNDTLTGASCTNLPTAGEEYNMTITSISGTQRNDHIIALRACKKCFAFMFTYRYFQPWRALNVLCCEASHISPSVCPFVCPCSPLPCWIIISREDNDWLWSWLS